MPRPSRPPIVLCDKSFKGKWIYRDRNFSVRLHTSWMRGPLYCKISSRPRKGASLSVIKLDSIVRHRTFKI
jgi:hypothetical protein